MKIKLEIEIDTDEILAQWEEKSTLDESEKEYLFSQYRSQIENNQEAVTSLMRDEIRELEEDCLASVIDRMTESENLPDDFESDCYYDSALREGERGF